MHPLWKTAWQFLKRISIGLSHDATILYKYIYGIKTYFLTKTYTQIFIAMNKASGGDGIPVELFQILKDAVKELYSIEYSWHICQQIWKTQQWPQDWKRSVFISIPEKGNAKECSNYHPICTHFTC